MPAPISRRTLLAAGAAAAGMSVTGVAAAYAGGNPNSTVRFTLNARTLDGGEQVVSITLHTARLGPVDPTSLSTGTFRVHAKATSPIFLAPGELIFSEYDLDRSVTGVRLNRRGDIVIELAYGEGQVGGGTLGYIVSRGRNVQLDLDYTITQNAPIRLRNGRRLTIDNFGQGRLSNPEVDAFRYRISDSGLKYRLYAPDGDLRSRGRRDRPLILWLHGGGEGASLSDDYYDNETTLRANRGALGFATPRAQRIFNGAYLVVPQSTSYWIEDGDRSAPLIQEIIGDLVRRYSIDRNRIYVAGASNGGYMTLKMTVEYRRLFAAAVPICGVVQPFEPGGPRLITDAELRTIRTPTWLVTSRNDEVVPPEPNTILAHRLIPDSLLTLYDRVVWNGHEFNGHWSWIYVARNDPRIDGTRIWQWMADQRR